MVLYGDRESFYDTKTTCFGSVVASDTFKRTITLTNNLTLNTLEAKVTLLSKTLLEKSFLLNGYRRKSSYNTHSDGNFITYF